MVSMWIIKQCENELVKSVSALINAWRIARDKNITIVTPLFKKGES